MQFAFIKKPHSEKYNTYSMKYTVCVFVGVFWSKQWLLSWQVIPVEGSEKVNGQDQKTYGEILHEIIISK